MVCLKHLVFNLPIQVTIFIVFSMQQFCIDGKQRLIASFLTVVVKTIPYIVQTCCADQFTQKHYFSEILWYILYVNIYTVYKLTLHKYPVSTHVYILQKLFMYFPTAINAPRRNKHGVISGIYLQHSAHILALQAKNRID